MHVQDTCRVVGLLLKTYQRSDQETQIRQLVEGPYHEISIIKIKGKQKAKLRFHLLKGLGKCCQMGQTVERKQLQTAKDRPNSSIEQIV